MFVPVTPLFVGVSWRDPTPPGGGTGRGLRDRVEIGFGIHAMIVRRGMEIMRKGSEWG